MDQIENEGIDVFEKALFGDDYQTDTDMSPEEADDDAEPQDEDTEENEETSQDTQDGAEGEEPRDGEQQPEDGGESPSGDDAEPDKTEPENQTFTLKVNKQTREVGLEEMKTLAQKGLDYDRVKDQIQRNQQAMNEMQERIDGYEKNQEAVDILGLIASGSNVPLSQVAETLYINYRKTSGISEDAARLELKNAKLDKELSTMKSQSEREKKKGTESDASEKMRRDIEDFKKEYPDVSLSDEVVDKLADDIRAGMSLTAAYRKMERAQEAQRVAELERQLAAEKQNNKNRRSSPGTQKDSGGRRSKSDLDVFEKALFG